MENSILDTSKVFDAKVRIQMLASLTIDDLTFKQLKEICNCSDGNMTTHTKKLVEEGFVSVKKEFKNNRPLTTYHLTDKGKDAFIDYVSKLNGFLKNLNQK